MPLKLSCYSVRQQSADARVDMQQEQNDEYQTGFVCVLSSLELALSLLEAYIAQAV